MPRSETKLEVIELSMAQAQEHGRAAVRASLIPGLGDGYVINESVDGRPLNGYLAGALVRRRRREGRYVYDIGSVDGALLQLTQLDTRLQADVSRIEGTADDHLQKQAGELQQLTERRQELPHWLDLTPLEQQYISESFGDIADARSRARHPTNLTVWATAARAEAGTREAIGNDVDPSLLLVTNALEQALIARRSELRHSQIINFTRTIRFNTWYIEEDRVLSAADRYLRDLLDHQDKETLAELRHRARLLRFHVQPLNQLAYRLQSSGGQPAANDVLETARAGMQFQRMHLYLRRPFAQLARAPLKTLGGSALDPLMAALNARGAVLESLDIGGSYRQLIGRLLGETAATKAAIERRDVRTAKRTAAHFNRLLSRYCLPHEPAVQEWYGYQL